MKTDKLVSGPIVKVGAGVNSKESPRTPAWQHMCFLIIARFGLIMSSVLCGHGLPISRQGRNIPATYLKIDLLHYGCSLPQGKNGLQQFQG